MGVGTCPLVRHTELTLTVFFPLLGLILWQEGWRHRSAGSPSAVAADRTWGGCKPGCGCSVSSPLPCSLSGDCLVRVLMCRNYYCLMMAERAAGPAVCPLCMSSSCQGDACVCQALPVQTSGGMGLPCLPFSPGGGNAEGFRSRVLFTT